MGENPEGAAWLKVAGSKRMVMEAPASLRGARGWDYLGQWPVNRKPMAWIRAEVLEWRGYRKSPVVASGFRLKRP